MFGALTKQNGQPLMNPAGNKTFFNTPKSVEALNYWAGLAQDGLSPKGLIEWGTLRQNFVEGKTAIMWHSTGNLTAVMKEAKFDVGVAPLPAHTEPGSPTGGGNFYLFKSGSEAEQQAAYRLVKFLTAPERSAQWSVATGYVGVSAASYDTPRSRPTRPRCRRPWWRATSSRWPPPSCPPTRPAACASCSMTRSSPSSPASRPPSPRWTPPRPRPTACSSPTSAEPRP
jgi:ABC-type glycerol-3-phosphate transport system substrate-binding protein